MTVPVRMLMPPVMTDAERGTAPDPAPPADVPRPGPAPHSETRETLTFLLKLALAVLILRSFIFAPFSIPSESMLPRLLIGDYLFISKWNYGYTRYSLPFSLPLIPGRVLPHDPARGDVVVFKAPPTDRDDYIKRVIGLPGDTVQLRRGQVILNGVAIPKQRIADFVLPLSANFDAGRCGASFVATDPAGQQVCRYPRYRETLPGGRSYAVLDQTNIPMDDTDVYHVPAGHVFLMGDNRDDSADSRFPAVPGGGIGFVPLRNLEGKAVIGFWSSDGSVRWWNPLSWFTAARFQRIGEGF